MRKAMKTGAAMAMSLLLVLSGMLPWFPTAPAFAHPFPNEETTTRPNILVIMGDDIGWFNISAYNNGIMGYRTPNIDRLAKEGILFTDFYGENSCTAGRAAFITGQASIRTGMTKVGLPGVDVGLQKEDPTLAELLKPLGYRTGQFGKNHLGDLDQYLPTAHGFDEFYGNLYHLNAEEEPENEDYSATRKSEVRSQKSEVDYSRLSAFTNVLTIMRSAISTRRGIYRIRSVPTQRSNPQLCWLGFS
jgi:arylsulfatase A-like enzyme